MTAAARLDFPSHDPAGQWTRLVSLSSYTNRGFSHLSYVLAIIDIHHLAELVT